MKINIILADDHQMIIDGVKSILTHQPVFNVIGEATNGKELIRMVEMNPPDMAIVDISMPEMDGIEASRIIKNKWPHVKIIILSMLDNYKVIKQAKEIGVDGFLAKNMGQEELFFAVEKIARGGTHYSEDIMRIFFEERAENGNHLNAEEFKLTKRELEILKFVAKGYTSQEISNFLSRAVGTIERHRKNMLNKAKTMLNLNNMTALVAYAKELGWLD
ncbi:MAG: response regulator transcription factor [Bacteroidota bacterium]